MRKLPAIESDYLLELENLPGQDKGYVPWDEIYGQPRPLRIEAVSYTHLTLPTKA